MTTSGNDDHPENERLLFQKYPELIGKLPWMRLADLPSPVQPMEQLSEKLGTENLWIKRDDLNSQVYSGNKPRKFEFTFAAAKKLGRDSLLTMGGVGSNQCVAATLHGARCGFSTIFYLSPQPVLSVVRKNILVNFKHDAKMIHNENEVFSTIQMLRLYMEARVKGTVPPYFMWFGASSKIGNLGFVEAGLELAKQIEQGQLPAPRTIFLPTGSCGTHAGLLVGLSLAKLPCEVIGVRVVPKAVTNRYVVAFHANRLSRYLHQLCPSIPRIRTNPAQVKLWDDFYGGQYGRPSTKGKAAMKLLQETEGITLDPTYTSKAFAGMLHFIKNRRTNSDPVLFWHTLNGVDLTAHTKGVNWEDLPEEMRQYFTRPLYDPEL